MRRLLLPIGLALVPFVVFVAPLVAGEGGVSSSILDADQETLILTATRTPDAILDAAEEALLEAVSRDPAGRARTLAETERRIARARDAVRAVAKTVAAALDRTRADADRAGADPAGADRAGLAGYVAFLDGRRALADALSSRAFESALEMVESTAAAATAAHLPAHAWAVRVQALEILAELYREEDVGRDAARLLTEVEGTPFLLAKAEAVARRAQSEHARGAIDRAWQSIQESLEIAREYPASRTLAFAADEAGWIAHSRAAHGVAVTLFLESVAAAHAAGDSDRLARALRSLGLMLENIGRVEEALARMDEAMTAARASGRPWRIADTAMHVAEINHRRGRAAYALRHVELAEEAILELPTEDPWMASRRLRLRFEIEVPNATRRETLRSEAERLLTLVPTRDRFPLLQLLTADARQHGEFAVALAHAQALVLSGRALGDSATRRALNTLAHCQYDAQDRPGALRSIETALRLAEDLRVQISDLRLDDRMVAGRSSRLHASFATQIAAELHLSASPASERDPLVEIARPDAAAYAERALLFLDFGRSRALLEELNDADDARLTLRPLGLDRAAWQDVRDSILGPHDLVLAYDQDARVAIAATRETVRVVRLPDAGTLERTADFAHHALRELADPAVFAAPAARLSEALLAPFEDLLGESDRILCLPSGPMHRLPLELLPRIGGSPSNRAIAVGEDARDRSFADVPFLFRTHAVEYVPSLGSIVRFDPAHDTPDRAFVIAHAGADDYPVLPMVSAEADMVCALFAPPRRSIAFTGQAATEAGLKRLVVGEKDLLHLAAHAWAEPQRGARSGIRLAAGDGDDGLLLAAEIMDLRLPIALAVVSGCDTGSGEAFGAEGVLSVGFALIAAGSRAVLVTVDPVEDRVPLRVLRPFYERVVQGDDPALALACARRALIASDDPDLQAAAIAPFLIVGRYGSPTR